MIGTILGFDLKSNIGSISGENGQRYKFLKDSWKESLLPEKGVKVDFDVDKENMAIDIYSIKDKVLENTNILLGVVAVAITFFFGFIGTFISRLLIAKEPIDKVIVHTLIHFVITAMLFIPLVGGLIYFGGTLYYMIKNYQLVNKS